MAQAQAEGTKDAQKAGIAHAKANDPAAYRGRKPTFSREQFKTALTLASQNATNTSQIAKAVGLSPSTSYPRSLTPSPSGMRRWTRFGLSSSRDVSSRQVTRRTPTADKETIEPPYSDVPITSVVTAL